MPLSTAASPLPVEPFRTPSVRLSLRQVTPSSPRSGPDGAWWPRSHDLAQELSELADVLDPLWGRLTHVAANPRHWPATPDGTIVVNDHAVRVDWFPSGLNPHRILLRSSSAGDWDLLVVPPRTAAPSAARLMNAAGAAGGSGRRPWPRG
ncbi:DUF5994 family protein [Streptomyces sp. NPDC048566]|uniref:DUF5994 family protein n=1 Tax=Streptomyces sp. NPDC048566 TaxID=3365569 RepID=UPI00371722F5